jgi:hypothetical protein
MTEYTNLCDKNTMHLQIRFVFHDRSEKYFLIELFDMLRCISISINEYKYISEDEFYARLKQ